MFDIGPNPVPWSTCHWYPVALVAVTEKAVLPPKQTDVDEGCAVIAGAEFTIRVALFEVAVEVQVLFATTLYK
ncbi:hypothetical protein D3C80_1015610 [compost metagenome]